MLKWHRFCANAMAIVVIGLAPCIAGANPPVIVATNVKPTLSGGHDLLNLTPSALEFVLQGSQFVRDAGASTGGVLLESGSPGLTFEHIQITSSDLPSFIVTPVLGDSDGGLFTQSWLATPITNGVSLDWQSGAPTLGQTVPDASAPGGVARYGLTLEFNPAANPNVDRNAFDAATFRISAVPEPGLLPLASGLLFGGGLLLRHARSRRRRQK